MRGRSPSSTLATSEEFDRALLWRFRARVVRVIDGDTVVILADTGFYGRHEVTLRLADVWAPELGSPEGELARNRLTDLLTVNPTGWNLRVVTRQKATVIAEQQSFARYVGDLFVVQPETGRLIDVGQAMIAHGYGKGA